jgi:hypothetical protein
MENAIFSVCRKTEACSRGPESHEKGHKKRTRAGDQRRQAAANGPHFDFLLTAILCDKEGKLPANLGKILFAME